MLGDRGQPDAFSFLYNMNCRCFLIPYGAVQASHLQGNLKIRFNFLFFFLPFLEILYYCVFCFLLHTSPKWMVTEPTQMTQVHFTKFLSSCGWGYETLLGDRVLLSPASSAQLLGYLFCKNKAVILSKLSWDTDLCCLCSRAYFHYSLFFIRN